MASNAMLAVPAKRSGYLDIKSPIEKYIASQFSSGAAQQAASALQRAQLLRNQAAELKGGADDVREAFQGCDPTSTMFVPDVSDPCEVSVHATARRSRMPLLVLVLSLGELQDSTDPGTLFQRISLSFLAVTPAGREHPARSACRYYRFLTALEGTLPVGKERGGANLRFQAGACDLIFKPASMSTTLCLVLFSPLFEAHAICFGTSA